MIIEDIRTHLINKNITDNCKLNISDTTDNQLVLWLYGGFSADIGYKASVQVKSIAEDYAKSETLIKNVFNELINDDPNKYKTINNTKMRITANQQPFFLEKDAQSRSVWVFNVTIITNRS